MVKSIYLPQNFSRDEIIYLAGIIDGEGSLVISKHRSNNNRGYNYQVTMSISNCDKRLLDWVQEKFGGRVCVYLYSQMPKNSKRDAYRWVCEGERLTHICECIYPFSIIKKEQIEIVLKMRYALQKPISHKGKQGVQPLPQEELDFRHDLFLKLKTLHCRNYIKQ